MDKKRQRKQSLASINFAIANGGGISRLDDGDLSQGEEEHLGEVFVEVEGKTKRVIHDDDDDEGVTILEEKRVVGNVDLILPTPAENFQELLDARKLTLTQSEEAQVKGILEDNDQTKVLVEKFNAPITVRLIKCLRLGVWLNDEVSNPYPTVPYLNLTYIQSLF